MKPIIDRWKRRYWRRDDTAIDALPGSRPAILVTGGSDGIGLALARVFADDPENTVVLIARDAKRLVDARSELERAAASPILTLVQDITASDAVERITDFLNSQDLYADVLINSAGVGVSGPFTDDTADRLEHVTLLNVTALTRLMHAFLPAMQTRGRGGILNIASLGGYAPGPFQAAYYASKSYVISLTSAVAYEARGTGVRIASVSPGPVNTEFHARARGETALYRTILPALSPEQVARSARRGFVLGRSVIIPGLFNNVIGLTMRLLPTMLTAPVIALLLKPRPATAHARPVRS